MMGGWHWDNGFGSGFGWVGLLVMVLFGVIIVVGVVLVVRSLSNQNRGSEATRYREGEDRPPSERQASALDVLEERYARGEIDRQEFLDRKSDLTG